MTTTEVAVSVIDQNELDKLQSPQDVLAYFAGLEATVDNNEVDGIKSLDIAVKESLIGVPFLILTWRFNESDKYEQDGKKGVFASLEIMLNDGTRMVVNDGSTGIRDQLARITDNREQAGHPTPQAGRMVRKGLRVSKYVKELNVDGKIVKSDSETFYLDF